MRDFRDAKAMAQTLRDALKAKSVSLTYGECLELVAKSLGFHDWNVLAAAIKSRRPPASVSKSSFTSIPYDVIPVGAIPILPLRELVLFPQMVAPIFVGRDKSKRAVESAMVSDGPALALTQRRASNDDPTISDLHVVGVIARVTQSLTLPDGNLKLLVTGSKRATVVRPVEGEFLAAEVTPIEGERGLTKEAYTLARAVSDAYQTYANINSSSPPQAAVTLPPVLEPGILADAVAPLLSIGIDKKQLILETTDVVARLETILGVMRADRNAT